MGLNLMENLPLPLCPRLYQQQVSIHHLVLTVFRILCVCFQILSLYIYTHDCSEVMNLSLTQEECQESGSILASQNLMTRGLSHLHRGGQYHEHEQLQHSSDLDPSLVSY